jgi:hypothetical protein
MGILDLMNGIEAAGDRGRARGQQTALGRLYSQAATAPREQRTGLLAQMGAISPQAAFDAESHFGKMDEAARKQLGQYAAAFSALPADQKAAAYPQLAEMGRTLGLPVPQGDYQPAYDAGIAQLGQAFGGTGGDQLPSDIRSLEYLQAHPDLLKLDRERRQAGGMVPKLIKTANGYSWGVPGQNLTPTYEGGDTTTPQNVDAIIAAANYMREQGVPDASIEGWINSQPGFGAAQPEAPSRAQPFVTPKESPDSFSTMTPAEVAAAGLPAGTFAQRNNKTGEVKVGPAQAQGEKPMSEYQRQQLTLKAGKARAAMSAATSDLDRMAIAVKKVLQNRNGLGRITGVVGAFPNIPGSDAANAKADLDALKSQIGFAVLQRMRSMSPTGGALGSVSDAEGKRLEANLAALDTTQSEAQLEQRLNDILDYVETSKQNLQDAYNEQFQPDGPQAPPRASNAPLRYNPATGDFE